jgi:hypothetical protein
MKLGCDEVRDLAPELLTEGLSAAVAAAAREHMASCAGCAAEFELARTLSRQRLQLPTGLQERVVAGIMRERPAAGRARMRLAIAATVALVIIGGREFFLTQNVQSATEAPSTSVDAPRAIEQTGPGWMSVEGALNSGAAGLGDLSEEQLRQLLTELES